MSRRRKTAFSPSVSSIQSLEKRELKTGNVSVEFSDRDIRDVVIEGDEAGNHITIDEIDPLYIRVTGTNGTLVNGSSQPVVVRVLDDLTIRMQGGSDHLQVRDLNLVNHNHSDLEIDMGTGEDYLGVSSVDVAREMLLRGGHANDSIILRQSTANHIEIDGEYQNDRIEVTEVTTQNDVTLDGGEGNDDISISDSSIADDLIIRGDADNDEVSVYGVDVEDDIRVDGGSGADELSVRFSDAEDIVIYGRTGNDVVSVYGNRLSDLLFVSLGSGNDELTFGINRVGRHYFDGGTGEDVWDSHEFWWSWSNFHNFE